MEKYAYARVSSSDQKEDRQLLALEAFGIPKDHIFVERQSGKDFERPEYRKLLRKLKPQDLLVIKSIDRLGRNYEQILEQWRILTKEMNVQIVVLDMPLLDTRNGKDLTGVLISDIVLQLLSYVAQCERENIKIRQAEGIAIAKQKGIQFGRKPIKMPEEYEEVREMWEKGMITATEAGKRLSVSRQTFMRRVQKEKNSPVVSKSNTPQQATGHELACSFRPKGRGI